MYKNYLSVIIPVFETEHTLSKCLETVKNQSLTDMEIIIVDDSHTNDEKCKKVIEPFLEDKRFKYISHGENKGLLEARRTGVEAANGRYITFIDSDDYIFRPHSFDMVKRKVDNYKDIKLVQFGCDIISKDPNDRLMNNENSSLRKPSIGYRKGENILIDNAINGLNSFYMWGKFFDPKILKQTYDLIPRDTGITMNEDLLAYFIYATQKESVSYLGILDTVYVYVRNIGITKIIPANRENKEMWSRFLTNGKVFDILFKYLENTIDKNNINYNFYKRFLVNNREKKMRSVYNLIKTASKESKEWMYEMAVESFGDIFKKYTI